MPPIEPTEDRRHWTLDVDGLRIWAVNEFGLMFYDPDSEDAWLACEDAPLLRQYR